MYKTIKAAQIAFCIYVALWIIAFAFAVVEGLNFATVMGMLIAHIGVIDSKICIGVREEIQDIENKLL